VKRLSPRPIHAPPWPKHDYPISDRCSTTSASNGTAGSSRRNGWRHSRSRISGRNAHPRSLSRGGECYQPPPGTSCYYGSWASSVGAFSFQLFVDRFRTRLQVTADPGACSATVTFELDGPGPISSSFLSRSAWASTALSGGSPYLGSLTPLGRVRAFSRRAGTELTFRAAN
jgi:hypothetical protein